MTLFEKIILFLQGTMIEPQPWGWFHLMSLFLTAILVCGCWFIRNRHSEKQLKCILALYAVPTFILEVLKQISWSATVTTDVGIIWDYQWYAFPFQLCTTPMIVCLVCLFLKKNIVRDALLSYVAFITILGSVAVMIIPSDCFIDEVLVNIHTTYLHFGSCVVSCYLLFSKEISVKINSYLKALAVFISFAMTANSLNILVYRSGILHGETFNMFYISPYFISTLPVFNQIQQEVPYLMFFGLYLLALSCGGLLIYSLSYAFQKVCIRIGCQYKKVAKRV